jgi:hypothetical protein
VVCWRCEKEKESVEFRPGHKQCYACLLTVNRTRHAKNRERYYRSATSKRGKDPAAFYKGRKKHHRNRRAYLSSLKTAPCTDCKRVFAPVCMDFDHVKGRKKANVTNLVTCSLSRLNSELALCELVCVNCHRLRTSRRGRKHLLRATQVGWVLDELKAAPCEDCGLRFPPEAMDFDHIDRKAKKNRVSNLRLLSYTRLAEALEEVRNCRLVCAVCHRLRTKVLQDNGSIRNYQRAV